MATALQDPVTVGAVFRGGQVHPQWFLRRGRRYTVQAVTLRWQTREGSAVLLHLSVTDGANDFELVFDPQRLAWRVEAVELPA